MLLKSCSDFKRELLRKSVHYNVKAIADTLLFKNVLVRLHEAKGDLHEKETEIKNRSLCFAAYK